MKEPKKTKCKHEWIKIGEYGKLLTNETSRTTVLLYCAKCLKQETLKFDY